MNLKSLFAIAQKLAPIVVPIVITALPAVKAAIKDAKATKA